MEKHTETKQKLLEAARKVFREKGYGKAKVSDIVAEAEVAQGTFYLYFKTKKGCLNSMITQLIESFLMEIKEERALLDKDSIYRVTKKIYDSINNHTEVLAIMHFEQLDLEDDVIDLHTRVHKEGIGLIKDSFLARGLNQKDAEIKTYLVDALIKQYLTYNVFIFNPKLRYEAPDFDKLLAIVIDEVNC